MNPIYIMRARVAASASALSQRAEIGGDEGGSGGGERVANRLGRPTASERVAFALEREMSKSHATLHRDDAARFPAHSLRQ